MMKGLRNIPLKFWAILMLFALRMPSITTSAAAYSAIDLADNSVSFSISRDYLNQVEIQSGLLLLNYIQEEEEEDDDELKGRLPIGSDNLLHWSENDDNLSFIQPHKINWNHYSFSDRSPPAFTTHI